MAKSTNLFNRDLNNKIAQPRSIGGLPFFNRDINDAQDNSTVLFGITSILRGVNCILEGCLVDEVKTDKSYIKVSKGTILLEGIVYQVDEYEGIWPFAYIPGTEEIDTRTFESNDSVDVAVKHGYTTTTSFTYPSGSGFNSVFPNNLTAGIYMNPFTMQRAEYLIGNNSKKLNEITSIYGEDVIRKTETNKTIEGGTFSAKHSSGKGQWADFGWTNLKDSISSGSNPRMAIADGSKNPGSGNGKEHSASLVLRNVPRHVHRSGTLGMSSFGGEHFHAVKGKTINFENGGHASEALGEAGVQNHDGSFKTGNPAGSDDGSHGHDIFGTTENGSNLGSGGSQLPSTPDSFSVEGAAFYVKMLKWDGYRTVIDNAPFFITGQYKVTNM